MRVDGAVVEAGGEMDYVGCFVSEGVVDEFAQVVDWSWVDGVGLLVLEYRALQV